MTPRQKRLTGIAVIIAGMALATALILMAFERNLMYFYSPTEVHQGAAPSTRDFRIGGLVVVDSVERDPESLTVKFTLTDTAHDIIVTYDGILPDLFREGQGIVAHGQLDGNGIFVAHEVLAKHDENYMPPEVADALAGARRTPSSP